MVLDVDKISDGIIAAGEIVMAATTSSVVEIENNEKNSKAKLQLELESETDGEAQAEPVLLKKNHKYKWSKKIAPIERS